MLPALEDMALASQVPAAAVVPAEIKHIFPATRKAILHRKAGNRVDAVAGEEGIGVCARGRMYPLLLSDRVCSGSAVLRGVGSRKATAVAGKGRSVTART